MIFAFLVILVNGIRLPWSEEGLIYAIFGAAVGFYIAIVMSMFLVWKITKGDKGKKGQ